MTTRPQYTVNPLFLVNDTAGKLLRAVVAPIVAERDEIVTNDPQSLGCRQWCRHVDIAVQLCQLLKLDERFCDETLLSKRLYLGHHIGIRHWRAIFDKDYRKAAHLLTNVASTNKVKNESFESENTLDQMWHDAS